MLQHDIIGCDAHKAFWQFVVLDEHGQIRQQHKVRHERGAIRGYLQAFPARTSVALETVGNWYWIADEMEAVECEPLLANATKAKVMMGHTNKTDKLDDQGLATLLRNGTLPKVWLPPAKIRDEQKLPSTRMFLIGQVRPAVGRGQRPVRGGRPKLAPGGAAKVAAGDKPVPGPGAGDLVKTLPGVGDILAIVIELEVGDITRFPDPQPFASYCGTVPKIHASGGKIRYGRLRPDVNRYLKWAFIEAANVVALNHTKATWRSRHVSRLYWRIKQKKGHAKAIGAVARHLSEAAYWVLKKGEPYLEPKASAVVSTQR